jgi:uncharacterized membrane-anchored protein YhcB (DUF1043 family)
MEYIVIAVIFILQLWFFIPTLKKIYRYESIFSNDKGKYQYEDSRIIAIYKTKNSTLETIIDSINNYLVKNKNAVSDFHLIKDIVDRNSDADEEEIHTQIPVPIFLGLMGTMIGIIVGIISLNETGGLDALFYTDSVANVNAGLNGVKGLLRGVEVAMSTSIIGILFNTISSCYFKGAKSAVEKNKNIFLSWIQAELLPNLSNDVSGALVKMTSNLSSFNNTFAQNTQELQKTLDKINNSYRLQADVIEQINRLNINEIASANIQVYEKLKKCTNEIGKLGEYLCGLNQYQVNTTDTIEKMQNFFSSGIEQIDSINIGVKNALERFAENSRLYLQELQERLDGQILGVNNTSERQQQALQQHFDKWFEVLTGALQQQQKQLLQYFEIVSTQMQTAATEQQEIFKQKLKETAVFVEELKQLKDVKEYMGNLVTAANDQKRELSNLNKRIEELAEIKVLSEVIYPKIPQWLKISATTGGGVIVAYCLFGLFKLIMKINY